MIGQSTKVGSAHIELVAKTDRFQRGMQDMQDQTRKATARVQNEIRKTDTEIKRMTGSAHMAASAIAAVGGVAAFSQLTRIADTFTQMRNKLQLVVKEGESLVDVEERLFQLALKNRAAIEPTVALYSRLRAARTDLSDEQALKIVDTWNKTLVISGASAGGAAAATIQLSQAMAGGILRAEEFNSIVENNVRAVQLFAASLGVSMGELRAMVNEGKVGFDQLVKAMTTDAGAVGDEFGKMSMTVGQAMTNLETSMIRFIGLQDTQFNGSKKLAEWINILAQNFDILATAILAAGASLATALGIGVLSKLAFAMKDVAVKMLAAGSAMKAFGMAAHFVFLGPWSMAIGAVAAAVGAVALGFVDMRTEAQKADDRLKEFQQTVQSNAALIKQWELAKAAEDMNSVGDAAEGAADGVDKLNAAMERGEKQMKIATLELKARIAQEDAARTQKLLDYNREVVPTRIDRGPMMMMQRGSDTEIARLEAKLAAQKQAVADLISQARVLGEIPLGFGGDSAGASKSGGDVTKLAGYYTALETYEKELAAIRKEGAKGAEGANRAIIQSMMNYLDAGGSVRRVLEDIVKLQGNMLDPTSIKHINDFITAMSVAETIDVPDSLETVITDGIEWENETAWTNFEQRIAEATKYGLMTAIETGEWGDAFGQILTDVTREALNNAIDVLWEALAQIDWGGKGQGWGGFLSMVGSSFAGRASGGPVSAGELYRVGEKGSEWFVPKVDGFIMPNDFKGRSMGSLNQISIGSPVININGNPDARTIGMIREEMATWSRALPAVIDARVTDRQKRGAY
jgi:tape measure domain-containing protein